MGLGWRESELVERKIEERDEGIMVSSHIILGYLNLKRDYSKNSSLYRKTNGGGYLVQTYKI